MPNPNLYYWRNPPDKSVQHLCEDYWHLKPNTQTFAYSVKWLALKHGMQSHEITSFVRKHCYLKVNDRLCFCCEDPQKATTRSQYLTTYRNKRCINGRHCNQPDDYQAAVKTIDNAIKDGTYHLYTNNKPMKTAKPVEKQSALAPLPLPAYLTRHIEQHLTNFPIIKDPAVIELLRLSLLKSRRFSADEYLSEETLSLQFNELVQDLTPDRRFGRKLSSWLLQTLLDHGEIRVDIDNDNFEFTDWNLNDPIISLIKTPQDCLSLLLDELYGKRRRQDLAKNYEFARCCEVIQAKLCEDYLDRKSLMPAHRRDDFAKLLQQWVVCYPPFMLVNFIEAMSQETIKTRYAEVLDVLDGFLQTHVLYPDLYKIMHDNQIDCEFHKRPDGLDKSSMEQVFFEGISGVCDAALRFSTRQYIAYLLG